MNKFLLRMDISHKVFELHNDLWFQQYLNLELAICVGELMNLVLGIILKVCFHVSGAIVLCASIPNLILSIPLIIVQYLYEQKLNKIKELRTNIDSELELFEKYDDMDELDVYNKFKKLSSINLSEIIERKDYLNE